jgi:hypothetical protein
VVEAVADAPVVEFAVVVEEVVPLFEVVAGALFWLAAHHHIPPITITAMTTHKIIFPVFDMM